MKHNSCEAVKKKNITVSIDEKTHRLARIRAAELDTSVSALVRNYLRSLVGNDADAMAPNGLGTETVAGLRHRELEEVLADFDARGVGLNMSDNLSREELYDRDRARAEAEEANRQRRRSTSHEKGHV